MKKYTWAVAMIIILSAIINVLNVNVVNNSTFAIAYNLYAIVIVLSLIVASIGNVTTTVEKTYRVKFKKLNDKAVTPSKGSDRAAGYDLYACIDAPVEIKAGETVKIPTGIAMELPNGLCAKIYARSGLATKNGLRPANCVGVCDSDYRGEYIVALHNDSENTTIVNPNDRVAQMIIEKHEAVLLKEVSDISETKRGIGGFGSTGR